MKLRLLIALVVVAAITLALAGWTVGAVRWLFGGGPARRPGFAPA